MALSRPWAEFRAGSVTWWINRDFDRPDLRRRLDAANKLMTAPAQRITRDAAPRNTEVARAEWNGTTVYIKRYRRKNLVQTVKDIFRPSRARRAFEVAFALNQHGVATPPPVAVGEVRIGRELKESFLITKEVANAKTFFEHRALAKDRDQTRALIRALARTLAKLHDAGFSHSDANFSNWLVTGPPFPQPNLLAIDLDGVQRKRFMSAKAAAKVLASTSAGTANSAGTGTAAMSAL